MTQDRDDSISYAIRIMPHAERDIEAHLVHLAETSGADYGLGWYDGLVGALTQLSLHPRRYPMISENPRFRNEVRQFLYRYTLHGSTWRVLFIVQEPAEDAPTVSILHVRHSAQRPITRAEARQIEFEQ